MSTITQLSIFINNEPGAIANISKTLKEANINLKAFNIAEGSGFGVLRAIADKPKDARERRERPDGKNILNGASPLAHFASLHSPGDSRQPP